MKKYLFLFAFVFILVSVSAWPVEIYENGTWVDLNSSDNGTANISINYYYTTQNNVTNVTEYNNVTETYSQNLSSYYNQSETDARYLRIGEQYANSELFNRQELNDRINNLSSMDANITAQLDDIKETPLTWLWLAILVIGLMATAALILWGKDQQ